MRDRWRDIAQDLLVKLNRQQISATMSANVYDGSLEFKHNGEFSIAIDIFTHSNLLEIVCFCATNHQNGHVNPKWLWPIIYRTGALPLLEYKEYSDIIFQDIMKAIMISAMQDIIEK